MGKILAIAAPSGVWVEIPGVSQRALARVAIATDLAQLTRAIEQQLPAVFTFEAADAARPILIGLVAPIAPTPEPTHAQASAPFVVEADADGQRVRVEAQEEVVFQCGKASLTLKRNGRIVLRGSYVETRASGTNRIRGGNVRIN
jgi:hypothetical protein